MCKHWLGGRSFHGRCDPHGNLSNREAVRTFLQLTNTIAVKIAELTHTRSIKIAQSYGIGVKLCSSGVGNEPSSVAVSLGDVVTLTTCGSVVFNRDTSIASLSLSYGHSGS